MLDSHYFVLDLFFFLAKFLVTIFVHLNFCFRYEGSIQPESLKILLEFTLARGNLTSLFKVLKLLYGKERKYIAFNIFQLTTFLLLFLRPQFFYCHLGNYLCETFLKVSSGTDFCALKSIVKKLLMKILLLPKL